MKYIDVASSSPQHLCLFGLPNAGKSTLVAQLAEAGKELIWISMDNGHGILSKLSKSAQERVNLIKIVDTKSNPIAAHTCLKLVRGGTYNICDTHGIISCSTCTAARRSFTTIDLHKLHPDVIVVWDPISQLVSSIINAIIRRETTSKTGKIADEEVQDMYKLDYGDWASLGNMMDRFLSEIQQAPYNTICITHVMESELEDGSKRLVPLAGTVNFSANSPKYFHSVVYAEVKLSTHRFGSGSTYKPNTITGARGDIKIEEMKNGPSLLPFFPVLSPSLIVSSTTEQVEIQREIPKVEAGAEVVDASLAEDNTVAVAKPSNASTAAMAALMKLKGKGK